MLLQELARISNGTLLGESLDVDGFSIDSRSIKEGQLYIAIKGDHFDGHDFVGEAIKKGASGAVISKDLHDSFPRIQVSDTKEFMSLVATHNREKFKGKVIGITGTNGKTTSKQILSNLLGKEGSCHYTDGNKNNRIGVPYSLLSLNNNFDFSVIEMGTSEPGEIKILAEQVRPDIAAITNVSAGHLDGLKDTQSIASEKGSIFNFHSDNGIAVLPRDSNFYEYWVGITNASATITFGLHKESDYRITEIKSDLESSKTIFALKFFGQKEQFEINGVARHNALNAALSIAIAIQCGISIEYIKENLRYTNLPDRRLSVFPSLKGSILIDDTYNANPASVRNAIESIKQVEKKKICIFGEMKELGENSVKIHEEILEFADQQVDQILCLGNIWKNVKNAKDNLKIFENHQELYEYIATVVDQDTLLLVKGSRSTRMDIVADKLKK